MRAISAFLFLLALPAWADSVVPTRTLRANSIISENDVALRTGAPSAGYASVADVIGQEARVVLYPGRPIGFDDIGPPAIVTRNQVVRVSFQSNGLQIRTEGRALERGAVGDLIRVMNLSSRATLIGQILTDGSIQVSP
jgi:flagella basal body P-ring formation protein FlgA